MVETTTKLRILLANVIIDAGAMRDIVTTEVHEQRDVKYLLHEVDRLQAAAHRIAEFIDHDVIATPRN